MIRYLAYFRAREARPGSAGRAVIKTLAQMAVFWPVFLGLVPALVYTLESALGLAGWRFPHPIGTGLGIALFAFAGALGLGCAMVMAVRGGGTPMPTDCAPRLVIAGPYRFVRNPMAIAGLSQGVAVGIVLGSPAVVLYAAIGGPVWNWFVRPWEEHDLERRFGGPYRAYREAVPCWLPRWRPYRG